MIRKTVLLCMLVMAIYGFAQNITLPPTEEEAREMEKSAELAGKLKTAETLYGKTKYRESIAALAGAEESVNVCHVFGMDFFMLGDYGKAEEYFKKAIALVPRDSFAYHSLGKTYGREADAALWPFTKTSNAEKSRESMEKALEFDHFNTEIMSDLLDFYLEAPGMLGGGMDKAEAMAVRIAEVDPAEGEYAWGLIAEKKKDFTSAETRFRKALKAEPNRVGRAIDIAVFLARRGSFAEAEKAFREAERISPQSRRLIFEEAKFSAQKGDKKRAKEILERYVGLELVPDDPSRKDAEELLKKLN